MSDNYFGLHSLVPAQKDKKSKKRVGRGESSGMGKTSGRGHKGQKARKSGRVRPGFEGGQNTLMLTHPKRGFSRKALNLAPVGSVNLGRIDQAFSEGAEVTAATLIACGAIDKACQKVKVLAVGELTKKMTFKIHAASQSAVKKIEALGCEIEWVSKK